MDQFGYLYLKKVIYKYLLAFNWSYLTTAVSDDALQINTSLEYPFQKNIYPQLSELLAPESLMTLQVLWDVNRNVRHYKYKNIITSFYCLVLW